MNEFMKKADFCNYFIGLRDNVGVPFLSLSTKNSRSPRMNEFFFSVERIRTNCLGYE